MRVSDGGETPLLSGGLIQAGEGNHGADAGAQLHCQPKPALCSKNEKIMIAVWMVLVVFGLAAVSIMVSISSGAVVNAMHHMATNCDNQCNTRNSSHETPGSPIFTAPGGYKLVCGKLTVPTSPANPLPWGIMEAKMSSDIANEIAAGWIPLGGIGNGGGGGGGGGGGASGEQKNCDQFCDN